jgi:hypothetical protein
MGPFHGRAEVPEIVICTGSSALPSQYIGKQEYLLVWYSQYGIPFSLPTWKNALQWLLLI